MIRKNRWHFIAKMIIPVLWVSLTLISCKEKKAVEIPPPEIPVVEVLQQDVPIFKEFVGQVYGEKDIPIRARVEGFLEGIHFQEGLPVTKGQLLYTVDPLPFEAKVNAQQSQVAEAETMLVKAKSDLDRYKPLAELNAVSQSDLDAAQAQYDAEMSSVAAAKANLLSAQIELGYTSIFSPINGVIGRTQARVGDFVGREPNPVILNTVSKTDNVYVLFYLTESEYLYLSRELSREIRDGIQDGNKEGEQATLKLILSDGSVYEHTGTVDFIDRSIDASTGSILIQATFPNPDFLLRPGLYAKVKVDVRTVKNGLLIPQRCVMELQGQYSVYVVNDSSIVESRQITTGPTIDDYWLITGGLKPEEKIVIDGLQKVKSGIEIIPVVTEFKSQFAPQ